MVICWRFLAWGSCQPMLSMIQVTRGHHLWTYLTSFYLNFPPLLAAHAFKYNIPFIKNLPFIKISPPPSWQPMLSMIQVTRGHLRPYLTPFYQKFPPPPLGNPCFQWFKLPGVICDPTWLPFIKIFPPWQPMLSMIQLTRGHLRPCLTSFYQNFPPPCLGSPCIQLQHSCYQKHSFNSFYHNFLPPLGGPCFQIQHSFYQKHSFYQNFPPPPLGNPCFQWFRLPEIICGPTWLPFIEISPPPPWQPMLSMIQVTRGHLRPYLTSFYQIFPPPLAAHAFNYNIPFIKNIPFLKIPPLAAHAFNYSGYQGSSGTLPDFLLSKFPPPSWQPMLSMIQVTRNHLRPYLTSFYRNSPPPPLGNPCFQWFKLPGVICDPTWLPFIKFSPPPWQPMLSTTTFLLSKTFLFSKSPPLAAHAFNYSGYQGSSATLPDFLLSNFPPLLATHAFNDSGYQGSSATLPDFLLSKFSPPGSPCFQWFRLPGVICDPTWLPFIKIFPPPFGSPCFQWYRLPGVFCDPTQLLYPCTMPNRGWVTQHTI